MVWQKIVVPIAQSLCLAGTSCYAFHTLGSYKMNQTDKTVEFKKFVHENPKPQEQIHSKS